MSSPQKSLASGHLFTNCSASSFCIPYAKSISNLKSCGPFTWLSSRWLDVLQAMMLPDVAYVWMVQRLSNIKSDQCKGIMGNIHSERPCGISQVATSSPHATFEMNIIIFSKDRSQIIRRRQVLAEPVLDQGHLGRVVRSAAVGHCDRFGCSPETHLAQAENVVFEVVLQ